MSREGKWLLVEAKKAADAIRWLPAGARTAKLGIVRALTPKSDDGNGEAVEVDEMSAALLSQDQTQGELSRQMQQVLREAFTDPRAIKAVAKRLEVVQNEHVRKRAMYMLRAAAKEIGIEVPDGD